MDKIAVIGAVLTDPSASQSKFNETVSSFKGIVKGRMGVPFEEANVSVISIIVYGTMDEINNLTGKLGNISGVSIKTTYSKKQVEL